MNLHEEIIVCYAAGYPDPFHCDTLEKAQAFAREHSFNHTTRRPVKPEIKRRWVSEWETFDPIHLKAGSK